MSLMVPYYQHLPYPRKTYGIVYKYWLLMREIVQNNSPRWLETVDYYISRDEVEGNIGPRSPVNEGSYFAQFPDYRAVNICFI